MLHAWCRDGKRAPTVGALLFCIWLNSSAAGAQDCAADRIDEYARVESIYDGDTIRLNDQRIVRFIAINTPERAHGGQLSEPLAEEATQALRALLPIGSKVGLRYDAQRQDRHRRTLAHVFTAQGINLSAALLTQGHGFAIVVAPNAWQVDCYFGAERQARIARRGVWSQAYYAARSAETLPGETRGFVRIKGRVTGTGKSRKNIWLDMGTRIALKVPRTQLEYFTGLPLENLAGRDIIARGWVNFYNNKLRMTISHPAMLEILD